MKLYKFMNNSVNGKATKSERRCLRLKKPTVAGKKSSKFQFNWFQIFRLYMAAMNWKQEIKNVIDRRQRHRSIKVSYVTVLLSSYASQFIQCSVGKNSRNLASSLIAMMESMFAEVPDSGQYILSQKSYYLYSFMSHRKNCRTIIAASWRVEKHVR